MQLNDITIDTATGKYYGVDSAPGVAGIYVGSLNTPGLTLTLDADFSTSGKLPANASTAATGVVVDDVTLSTGSTTVTYTEGSSAVVVNDSSTATRSASPMTARRSHPRR